MDEIAAEGRREDERRQREAEDEERERKANKKKRKATENLASSGSHAGQSIDFHFAQLLFTCPFSPGAFHLYHRLNSQPHTQLLLASPGRSSLAEP